MTRRLAVLLLLLLGTPSIARAEGGHSFGLGLELGAPTGLAGKVYLHQGFALEFGVGYLASYNSYQGVNLHVEAIWHPAVLTRQESFNLALTIGAGGRVFEHRYITAQTRNVTYVDNDAHIGARIPIGLVMDFFQVHLDLFLDIVPTVDFLFLGTDDPNHDAANRIVDLEGVLGGRYYF